MSVILMGVVDGRRRLETNSGVGIFRIIFGIQVESTCLAVYCFSNIEVTDSLIILRGSFKVFLRRSVGDYIILVKAYIYIIFTIAYVSSLRSGWELCSSVGIKRSYNPRA